MVQDDLMYIVIADKAIAVDYAGTPIICDLVSQDDIEYVDWDSADTIDWMDLTPHYYQLYKNAVDFIHQHTHSLSYTK